jgi:hypothetical protein
MFTIFSEIITLPTEVIFKKVGFPLQVLHLVWKLRAREYDALYPGMKFYVCTSRCETSGLGMKCCTQVKRVIPFYVIVKMFGKTSLTISYCFSLSAKQLGMATRPICLVFKAYLCT